ncbi:MAG: CPBP family intramembrane metalloprotease [Microlunatus sp.]|nr:CPBP family intramembrane metalloprotease [Microlunatus sp.]
MPSAYGHQHNGPTAAGRDHGRTRHLPAPPRATLSVVTVRSIEPASDQRTTARRVAVFVLLAYALAWLVCLPLWLSGRGLETPGAGLLLIVMMYAPGVAALITRTIVPDGTRPVDALLLRPGSPRRWWLPALIGWIGIPIAAAAAMFLAIALGFMKPDFAHLSGFAAVLRSRGAAEAISRAGLPLGALVAIQVLSILPGAFINMLAAIGEETGWRGFLQPVLTRVGGRWVGIVGTGIIWGLWHTPILLLGYNFPALNPGLRLLWMVVACIILSAIFGHLVDRAGTVWVSALAHGTLNASAGLPVLFVAAGSTFNAALVSMIGVAGWIVNIVFYLILRLVRKP